MGSSGRAPSPGITALAMRSGFGISLPQESGNCPLNSRELVVDHIPQDVYVDPEVFVDEDVPEPGDLLPLDLATASPEIGWEALDGFADDFEVPHHRVDRLVVRGERILRP